ncbi:MAG TPA: rhomboid family intramembrane serine protease [Gemmataceae bacterium]|nr:rhomboid family intramembrane serine protease [Gemmataceae bacterium]
MGIYDRDYYRREGPSLFGSFAERGTVCKWLIGVNAAVFILQMFTRGQGGSPYGPLTDALDLQVDKVLHGQVWRLVSYAFLHDPNSVMHILFNMLFLWWFGADLEDLYRPKEFLAFYLTSAVAGGVAHVALAKLDLVQPNPVLGASGAVTAVVMLCALHYPTKIILLFFFLPVPIWAFVVFMVAKDAFTLLGRAETGVAVDVHLAGAAFGFFYQKCHLHLTSLWPQLKAWRRRQSQPRLRVYRDEEETPTPVGVAAAAPAPADEEQLEAKMDAILEKISRTGKESLTETERALLLRASEIYKRKRH